VTLTHRLSCLLTPTHCTTTTYDVRSAPSFEDCQHWKVALCCLIAQRADWHQAGRLWVGVRQMYGEEVRSRKHQGTNAKGENRHGTLEASEDPQ